MNINIIIFQKARRKIRSWEEEKKYIEICMKAMICPECGGHFPMLDFDIIGFTVISRHKCEDCGFAHVHT
jgi:hypothetical protein